MEYELFLIKEEELQDKIKAIHKSISTMESTIVALDEEASKAIEELYDLQNSYYGLEDC